MIDKPGSSQPMPTSELTQLEAELAMSPSPNPPPHPSLPATPGPGSNVAYVSKEENDRLVSAALALGMGQFAKMTADETHMFAARLSRR